MLVIDVLLGILLLVDGSVDIHKKLSYYETLTTVNIVSRRRRSANDEYVDSKEVRFHALGRDFHLVLFPGMSVLAPGFQAKSVDAFGVETPFYINHNDLYTGHLADDASVSVSAHFEDGILTSTIQCANETYAVEPAWRHLPPSANHTMIVYRGSDMKRPGNTHTEDGERRKFSVGIKLFSDRVADFQSAEGRLNVTHGRIRQKRTSTDNGPSMYCPVLVVADYDFFKDVGVTKQNTALYLVNILTRIQKRFLDTVWEDGMRRFSLQIKELLIHTAYTSGEHYNAEVKSWKDESKLRLFSLMKRLSQFCLGHLYMGHALENNILGVAFTASASKSGGGICSSYTKTIGGYLHPNTGVTSAQSEDGVRLLTMHFELVSTHEFGHSFGSEHDPDSGECAPSSFHKGKYVMWAYTQAGWEPNNHIFSPCSKRWIAPTLQSKSKLCFQVEIQPFCGNAMIEKGEECDEGLAVGEDADRCCTDTCKLVPGANCSGINFECCVDCKVAPNTTRCAEELQEACRQAAFCDGKDFTKCPLSDPADDGTPCLEKGKCEQGKCLSFCETLGKTTNTELKPCVCEQNTTAACRYCCMIEGKGTCEPTDQLLGEGRPCGVGYCKKGVCVKEQTDLVIRLYHFLTTLDASSIMQFMKTNIVGAVMVISMVIWLSASFVIRYYDRKQRELFEGSALFKKETHRYKTLSEAIEKVLSKTSLAASHKLTVVRFVSKTTLAKSSTSASVDPSSTYVRGAYSNTSVKGAYSSTSVRGAYSSASVKGAYSSTSVRGAYSDTSTKKLNYPLDPVLTANLALVKKVLPSPDSSSMMHPALPRKKCSSPDLSSTE